MTRHRHADCACDYDWVWHRACCCVVRGSLVMALASCCCKCWVCVGFYAKHKTVFPFSHTAHLRLYKKNPPEWHGLTWQWHGTCHVARTTHLMCIEPCHCFLPPGMHWQWQVPSMMEGSWSSHTSVVNGRASVVYLVPSRWEVPGPGPRVRAGT